MLVINNLQQISPEIRHAAFGNVGSIISFRVGAEDAPYLARELRPQFSDIDLMHLVNHRIYVKLLIDGMPSSPFSARTLPSVQLAQLAI